MKWGLMGKTGWSEAGGWGGLVVGFGPLLSNVPSVSDLSFRDSLHSMDHSFHSLSCDGASRDIEWLSHQEAQYMHHHALPPLPLLPPPAPLFPAPFPDESSLGAGEDQ